MQTFSLKTGLALHLNGRQLFIDKRLIDRRLSLKDELGEPRVLTEDEFYRYYDKKELTIDPEQPHLGRIPTTTNAPPDLSCFRKPHAEEAIRRRDYLSRLMGPDEVVLPPDSELSTRITAIASAISDKKRPPSNSTIRRWFRAFRATKCVVQLVPKHHRKGRPGTLRGDVEEFLQDTLHEEFLKKEPQSISQLYQIFRDRLIDLNKQRLPSKTLALPCEMTVRRYIERLDPYAVDVAQLGKFAGAKKHRNAIGELTVKQIQDRWEIDHTLLDVLIVDPETGEVIGRAYITVVIDRYSRLVMSYLIHLAAPNTESVLRVIERAIRPKQAWLERFPSVTNTWAARGLPLRVVPDNAAEFHADDLVQAFNELGIEILYPRSRGPQMKGAVERFFRTLNDGLVHRLPGTTFSNTKQRGDYPSEKLACLTLSNLESCVIKWIVDVYHQKPHRGLGRKTPAQVWELGESQRSLSMPTDLDSLESVLASRKMAPVHHYGIETDGVIYHSDELGELRLRLDDGEKVNIRLRDELGHIWVKDRFRNHFILVPAKNKQFIGLSRDIYREARKRVTEKQRNAKDHDAVVVAYRQIMAEADAAKASNKLRKRRQAAKARLDKEGQVRPDPQMPEKSTAPKRFTVPEKGHADLPQPKIRARSY